MPDPPDQSPQGPARDHGSWPSSDCPTISSFLGDEPPDRIGPYRIIRKLGEGGMGEVYEAEQETPLRRKVAVKLMKWGLDPRQVIARFQAERHALALMNHPNVATVFDAGVTEAGRPFFVMELVSGLPITEHCDGNRLTNAERLELFLQVCEGVQHAHHKGIIHRDLKPSNIIVEAEGDRWTPKIIDFGVAKATAQRLTERTLFTERGVMVGTPEYMSPEQAGLDNRDVDTRADVYSLGVTLYELLVGALPLGSKELRRAGFDEIRRRIREVEPSKPSTKVSTLGNAAVEPADRRRTTPRGLAHELRGDLDWITLRALEKDRNRRYQSPSELAEDLSRHLQHLPARAGPPTIRYRIGKFVRRHPRGVALTLVLVGFLAVLVVVVDSLRFDAAVAELRADSLDDVYHDLEVQLMEAAGEDARSAEIFRDALSRMSETRGATWRFSGSMALLSLRIGDYESVLRRGSVVCAKWGQASFVPSLRRAIDLRERDLGPEHRDVEFARTLENLALVMYYCREFDAALELPRRAIETRRRIQGPLDPAVASSLALLATTHAMVAAEQQEREAGLESAWSLFRDSVEIWRHGTFDEDARTLANLTSLAEIFEAAGQSERAIAVLDQAIELVDGLLTSGRDPMRWAHEDESRWTSRGLWDSLRGSRRAARFIGGPEYESRIEALRAGIATAELPF